MHKSDTMEEKLSLVHRFGVTINYSKPTQKEYFDIAIELCRRLGVELSDDEIKIFSGFVSTPPSITAFKN